MADVELPSEPRALAGVRVLVLGASGFLGRWVARLLTRAGAEVHAAVRDPDRAAGILERWGVDAEIHAADLSKEPEVLRLLTDLEPAITFNLAGYGVAREERDEGPSTILNAQLPTWLARELRSVRESSWRGMTLVHAGSALEYGDARGDLDESATCRPTTLYGRTKLEGTLAVASTSGIRAVVARIFTAYGPGEHEGRLLPSIRESAGRTGPIALGDAAQRRDFVFAEDVAEGLLRLACAPGRESSIVNLATGRLASVREFALLAAERLGIAEHRLSFGALPPRAEEMVHGPVSVSRLRELAGWSPPPSLEDGIARALAAEEKLP